MKGVRFSGSVQTARLGFRSPKGLRPWFWPPGGGAGRGVEASAARRPWRVWAAAGAECCCTIRSHWGWRRRWTPCSSGEPTGRAGRPTSGSSGSKHTTGRSSLGLTALQRERRWFRTHRGLGTLWELLKWRKTSGALHYVRWWRHVHSLLK